LFQIIFQAKWCFCCRDGLCTLIFSCASHLWMTFTFSAIRSQSMKMVCSLQIRNKFHEITSCVSVLVESKLMDGLKICLH
jgi:hypothetical protein